MNTIALEFHGEFSAQDVETALDQFHSDSDFFVLQIGAMDGLSFDPVHGILEKYGWPSLRLEPQPEFYSILLENCRGLPRVGCLNRAVAEYTGEIPLYRIPPELVINGKAPSWLGGIASIHRDRNALGGKGGIPAETVGLITNLMTSITVPCSTLADLIAERHIHRIDALVIDAEGSDWMILRQLDFDRFQPKLIYFEFCNLPNYERSAAMALLSSRHYRIFISVSRSDVLAVRVP